MTRLSFYAVPWADQPIHDSKTIEHEGKAYPIGNSDIAIVGHVMHWNPEYFPEPSQFWPERFLESPSSDANETAEKQTASGSPANGRANGSANGTVHRHPLQPPIPRNVYRPFERGVRSCLGRHLATDEMRLMLVATARFFDFELVDHAPSKVPALSFSDHDTRIGIHAFQRARLTAGPSGPAWMKARLTKEAGE